MNMYLVQARIKAINYLRSRNKWLADKNCTFKPTSAAATDVKKTWATLNKKAR